MLDLEMLCLEGRAHLLKVDLEGASGGLLSGLVVDCPQFPDDAALGVCETDFKCFWPERRILVCVEGGFLRLDVSIVRG